MTTPLIPVSFRPRTVPLEPRAVAAHGPAAANLADRLLALGDDALTRLSGVAGCAQPLAPRPSGSGVRSHGILHRSLTVAVLEHALLIAIGDPDALPWVDGVLYLGRDLRAPSLLVPTALEPTVPLPLLERAVLARAPSAALPIALLCDARSLSITAIAATGAARPIQRRELRRWIKATRRAEGDAGP